MNLMLRDATAFMVDLPGLSRCAAPDQAAAPTRSARPNASCATQFATSNSAASRSVRAEKLQAERQAFVRQHRQRQRRAAEQRRRHVHAVLPVEPRPTGAAPQAPSVTNAS